MDNQTVVESKSAVTSTSTWGFVIAGLPLLLQLLGISPTSDDAAVIASAVHHGESIYASAMAIIGTVMLFVGRYNARQPIHFVTPFQIEAATGRKIAPVIPLDVKVAMAAEPKPLT